MLEGIQQTATKYANFIIMSNLTLASHKRILMRYTNQLQNVLTRFKDAQLEEISFQNLQDEITPIVIYTSLQQVEGLASLENMTIKFQHALDELAVVEKTHPTLPNIEDEFAQYLSAAEEAIGNTFDYHVFLDARIHGLKAHAKLLNTSHKSSTTDSGKDETTTIAVAKNLVLPTIAIPTFNGDIWGWDNFSELFNLNVHSQNLSQLQKFN
uniref:LXG domain-containing protein n=1 Tax=Angiostrongylus cantonensis TaxID=6313 RepID=A0A0K0DED3_ANGCA